MAVAVSDFKYASVLGKSDIEALSSIKDEPDMELLGGLIGAYCGVLKVDFETFHDTVAMAATVVQRMDASRKDNCSIKPFAKLDERDSIPNHLEEVLKETSAGGIIGDNEDAKWHLAKFKSNMSPIDATLLANACKEYAKYIGKGMNVKKDMTFAQAGTERGGDVLISMMMKKLNGAKQEAAIGHLTGMATKAERATAEKNLFHAAGILPGAELSLG